MRGCVAELAIRDDEELCADVEGGGEVHGAVPGSALRSERSVARSTTSGVLSTTASWAQSSSRFDRARSGIAPTSVPAGPSHTGTDAPKCSRTTWTSTPAMPWPHSAAALTASTPAALTRTVASDHSAVPSP